MEQSGAELIAYHLSCISQITALNTLISKFISCGCRQQFPGQVSSAQTGKP